MKKQMVLTVKNKSEVIYLPLNKILYIQADGNYCDIHLTDGSVINTLTYQRAEIARMMKEQLPEMCWSRFAMLGRFYMVNKDYILRIQPGKQQLTFVANSFGTIQKITIKATAKALDLLEKEMEGKP